MAGLWRDLVVISFVVCFTGRVTVHLTDLPNGQQDDQWHQLLAGGTRVSRGSIRLAARFKVRIFCLPITCF